MKKRNWFKIGMLSFIVCLTGLLVFPQSGCAKDTLLVYSGAGMRKPMDEIGSVFQKKFGTQVKYNYAGSQALLLLR